MRQEIISKHNLDKFNYGQFNLSAPNLSTLDIETALPHKVAFKQTIQMSGAIGGDVIKTGLFTNQKGKNLEEELVIKPVAVAKSMRTGQFGIILCQTWENLFAIIITDAFKQGKIQYMIGTDDLEHHDIMNMPSANPGSRMSFNTNPLLKTFTLEELDQINMLSPQALLMLHTVVMNKVAEINNPDVKTEPVVPVVNSIVDEQGFTADQIKTKMLEVFAQAGLTGDIMALPNIDFADLKKVAITALKEGLSQLTPEQPVTLVENTGSEEGKATIPTGYTGDITTPEYRKSLLAELTKNEVAFAKNITTKAAMDLLRDNDPTNAILPQKSEEALKQELLS